MTASRVMQSSQALRLALARQRRPASWPTCSSVNTLRPNGYLLQQQHDARVVVASNTTDTLSLQRRWFSRKGAKMGRHLETLDELAHRKSHREAQERHRAKKQKKKAKKEGHVQEEEETLAPLEMDEEETNFDQIEEDDVPVLPDPKEVMERMNKVVVAMEESFKSIRGSEPTPELFDPITVKAYGEENTPLSSVAQVVITSPTLATVTCYDPALAKDVKTAIMLHLELNPQIEQDGLLRVPLPRPSAESRQKTVQQLGQQAEAGRTRIRNIRRAALEVVKKGEKGKLEGISKDDAFRIQKEIDANTEKVITQLNQVVREKQENVMAV